MNVVIRRNTILVFRSDCDGTSQARIRVESHEKKIRRAFSPGRARRPSCSPSRVTHQEYIARAVTGLHLSLSFSHFLSLSLSLSFSPGIIFSTSPFPRGIFPARGK